ncbi:hypothetical protein ACFYS8_13290 [Kitasatospora sp. NPDC004615]|uniref:hypothetical protein n=1 Tax=unclassified Kitasatospora TaxID=2633591 RepID=UPI00368E9F48
MPRPAAAAALPDPAGQPPAEHVTRFPARWLGVETVTGDTLRAVTLVGDYARMRDGYCWAADPTLAAVLRLHPRTVAAALRTAEEAGLVQAERRPGGTSARTITPAAEDELMVCISAAARNTLGGSQFVTYCALAVRQHLDDRTSMRRISAMCGISEATARTAVAELVATGWISRTDSAGAAAHYTAHPAPIAGIPTQLALFAKLRRTAVDRREQPAATAPAECDGQLSFDFTPPNSAPTTPPNSAPTTPPNSAPQTGSLQQDPSNRPAAVGGCGSGAAETTSPRDTGARPGTRATSARAGRPSASPAPTTTLPPLLITPQIRRVLAELPDALIDRMSRWEQREAARAIGAAIHEADGNVVRVADRVQRRWAFATPDAIRSSYGWLTRVGLARRGCDRPSCEAGWDFVHRADCIACGYLAEGTRARAAARRHPAPAAATTPAPPAGHPPVIPRPSRPRYCPTHPSVAVPCAMCAAPAASEPVPDAAARARALATARTARAAYRGTTVPTPAAA